MSEESEVLTLVLNLPNPGPYDELDQYRDFRQLFLGSDQGKRVLYELVSRAGLFRPKFKRTNPIDPHRVTMEVGGENFLKEMLRTIVIEPKAKPTTAKRSKE